MIDYDNLIKELGLELGAELKFNDEDMCELAVGESTVLSIERRPDAGTLLMTSVVADALPDPVDYALVLDLLDFSLGGAINGTPAIGRDAESGLLVAHQTVTARSLRDASFADVVKDFLRFREVMERKLNGSN
jgi:hypothetical protein